jgi:two-component system LytT family sensor kinase
MMPFKHVYDKWTWRRISRHLLYWLFWLIFYATVNVNYKEYGNYGTWVLIELCVLPIKISFSYLLIYYILPTYGVEKKYIQFFVYTLVVGAIGGFLLRSIDLYIIREYLLPTKGEFQLFTFSIAYQSLDLIFTGSIVLVIKLIQNQIQSDKITKELQQQRLESELQYLKHQLQPHFLFNTLNNLYGLILTHDKNAADVVIKLSEIMNYMLYQSNETYISLDKELENLNNYIDLEKLRYGDKVEVVFDVVGSIKDKKIAPLILISFVENAFKHGPAMEQKNSWISILLEIDEESLIFKVENNLDVENLVESNAISTRVNSGIGLSNVRKRLALIYPDAHELEVIESDSYLTSLKINL